MIEKSDDPEEKGPRRVSPPAGGPELVIAIVRPVGTPGSEFLEKLSGNLHSYGYEARSIKLSGILADIAASEGSGIPTSPEDARINGLMTKGDEFCRQSGNSAGIALMGVTEIRTMRVDKAAGDEDAAGTAIPRVAYVLDSLKRPAEVTQLRQIYGDHLLVIGLQASVEHRRKALVDKMRPQRAGTSPEELESLVRGLIARDLKESDDSFDQNTLQTFPMSDVFIDVEKDPGPDIARVLDLLFGNPDYPVPKDAEFGMQLAQAASTRTAELGLKVGAVLMRGRKVLGIGANEHPERESAPEFDESSVDIRALVMGTVAAFQDLLKDEELARFDRDPDTYVAELFAGPLKSSPLRSLTEFQPTVHAEMSALLDAVGRGDALDGARMYVTAYPCHNCAKHLLALGLEVIYLEPYPKSRAASMYGPSVEALMSPFTGVAPRRYKELFEPGPDRKGSDGARLPWSHPEKLAARPRINELLDQHGIAAREAAALNTLTQ